LHNVQVSAGRAYLRWTARDSTRTSRTKRCPQHVYGYRSNCGFLSQRNAITGAVRVPGTWRRAPQRAYQSRARRNARLAASLGVTVHRLQPPVLHLELRNPAGSLCLSEPVSGAEMVIGGYYLLSGRDGVSHHSNGIRDIGRIRIAGCKGCRRRERGHGGPRKRISAVHLKSPNPKAAISALWRLHPAGMPDWKQVSCRVARISSARPRTPQWGRQGPWPSRPCLITESPAPEAPWGRPLVPPVRLESLEEGREIHSLIARNVLHAKFPCRPLAECHRRLRGFSGRLSFGCRVLPCPYVALVSCVSLDASPTSRLSLRTSAFSSRAITGAYSSSRQKT
jgi:hypothetical protein